MPPLPNRSHRRALVVAAALTLVAGRANAQRALGSLAPEERIRVRVASTTFVGSLVRADADSLLVQTTGGTRNAPAFRQTWVPLECVQQVDVPAERMSVVRGASIGGGFGLLTGAVTGVAVGLMQAHFTRGEHVYDRIEPPRDAYFTRTRGVAGAVSGAVLGAALGVVLRPARWQRMTLPSTVGDGLRRTWTMGGQRASRVCEGYRF